MGKVNVGARNTQVTAGHTYPTTIELGTSSRSQSSYAIGFNDQAWRDGAPSLDGY